MAKDPAFLFYPNDWIGGTMGMTFEEKGAYMELLMMQFNRGHMTSHMIGQTIGQIWVKIENKFKKDENGLYYNVRLEQEQLKRKEYTESRRNNKFGMNQYVKKESKKEVKEVGHMTSHMIGHMENENENIIINKDYNFIQRFNLITGKKIRIFDNKAKKQFNLRIKEGFTIDDIEKAIENCSKDKFHIDNPKYLTPEFITRVDKLQMYLHNEKIIKQNTKLY